MRIGPSIGIPGDAASAGGFSPAKLSGLTLWLRADLGITLNAGNVSAWADQSGNGNHITQTTAAAQPNYSLTGQNNQPKVSVTAAGRVIFSPSPFTLGAFTYYFVSKWTSATGYLFYRADALATSGEYVYRPAAAQAQFACGKAATVLSFGPAAYAWQTVPTVYSFRYNGNSGGLVLAENGVDTQAAVGASPGTANESRALYLGQDSGAGGATDADYYEIIALNKVASASEDAQVVAYLRARYAI